MGLEAAKIAVYRRLPRPLQQRAVRHGTPNFTVGALGLVTMTGEELLLTRPSYRQGWLPPGGFLQRGEDPRTCLQRELHEELGLAADVREQHRVGFDVERQGVTFLFVAVVPEGTVPVPRGPELLEVRWFGLDALPPVPPDFSEGRPAADLAAVRAARA